ncbi:hypothetical protein F183_A36900 [Bryobacterales bacterium F-183]|nr:hypothetical protein F183_A36900 [Bryobacterales bacterium F-183]
MAVAIGRLSQRFRLLLEESNADAKLRFYGEPTVKELTEQLKALGYDWELFTVNPITNSYDVRLSKQGTSFLVSEASSGERELLTYLFAIFALNVRNAVIIVDEPELHLHPRWQSSLLALFVKLSKSTGNQFIFATHSPTFISPRSIQYVSRVYSEQQRSNIVRMNSADLPNIKHLFNIVNSENNQRMLFSDAVVLVEGLHDRMVFERILSILVERSTGPTPTLEVVSIGGKGLFPAYQKLLDACKVPWWSVADLDYIEQIGSPDLKSLFAQNNDYIKTDVFENIKSRDGDTFVRLVEQAMQSGDWHDARDLWAYIKSRRRTLRDSLDPAQEAALAEFIEQCKTRRIYLLSRGALEDYLPVGYRSKDTEKLIELIGSDDFWDKLDLEGRRELESMALIFLETAAVPPQASQPTE